MIKVKIDPNSGFCFGVVNAIQKAEEYLSKNKRLYCIGDIVHNREEINRLEKLGMETIDKSKLKNLDGYPVLIRAHGEPPSTYDNVRSNNLELVDATCPIVLKLQEKIRKLYESTPGIQIVIFGKHDHAEVIGLVGQTENTAIVVRTADDVEKLDRNKKTALFSQTTMPLTEFEYIKDKIEGYIHEELISFDTICRKVANRVPEISKFASNHDVCVFVAGRKSSNGRMLYEVCKKANPDTYFVSSSNEIEKDWFREDQSVGICGATSTPQWLMEEVKSKIESLFQ